jgi:hypothetical protein
MSNWSDPPKIRVTVGGKPLNETGERLNAAGRPMVTRLDDGERVRRAVCFGKVVEWEGRMHSAGAIIHLSPERANELVRAGLCCHPADYRVPPADQPVTIQCGRVDEPSYQGPRY